MLYTPSEREIKIDGCKMQVIAEIGERLFFVPLGGIGTFSPSGCIPVLMTIKWLRNDDAMSSGTQTLVSRKLAVGVLILMTKSECRKAQQGKCIADLRVC